MVSINSDLDLEIVFKQRLADLQDLDKQELINIVIGLESELFFSEQERISLLSELFLQDTKLLEKTECDQ